MTIGSFSISKIGPFNYYHRPLNAKNRARLMHTTSSIGFHPNPSNGGWGLVCGAWVHSWGFDPWPDKTGWLTRNTRYHSHLDLLSLPHVHSSIFHTILNNHNNKEKHNIRHFFTRYAIGLMNKQNLIVFVI